MTGSLWSWNQSTNGYPHNLRVSSDPSDFSPSLTPGPDPRLSVILSQVTLGSEVLAKETWKWRRVGTLVRRLSDLSPMLGWALQDAGASSGTLMTHWPSKLDPDGIISLDLSMPSLTGVNANRTPQERSCTSRRGLHSKSWSQGCFCVILSRRRVGCHCHTHGLAPVDQPWIVP